VNETYTGRELEAYEAGIKWALDRLRQILHETYRCHLGFYAAVCKLLGEEEEA